VFLVEYGSENSKNASNAQSQRIDYREVLNPAEYALYDKLRNLRKEIGHAVVSPLNDVWTLPN
jgi:hypothetical protein